MSRHDNRQPGQIRPITIEKSIAPHAQGSVLISFGNTKVICAAMIEESVPRWMKEQNVPGGWITAEYNMLARSTHSRNSRDPMKPNGRNIEIQRLIGRSLRSVIDVKKLGERQIIVDCDVLQADGGTRCAAITGGYVALALAVKKILAQNLIKHDPLTGAVCGISCGIFNGETVLDLDYEKDSKCEVDCNFVINENFDLIEVQGTAERGSMSFAQLSQMFDFAKKGAEKIFEIQREALGK
jgi:ribonuclease PH